MPRNASQLVLWFRRTAAISSISFTTATAGATAATASYATTNASAARCAVPVSTFAASVSPVSAASEPSEAAAVADLTRSSGPGRRRGPSSPDRAHRRWGPYGLRRSAEGADQVDLCCYGERGPYKGGYHGRGSLRADCDEHSGGHTGSRSANRVDPFKLTFGSASSEYLPLRCKRRCREHTGHC
jgi:hypothetical protein